MQANPRRKQSAVEYLEIAQLGERVQNDAKDDVQADSGDDDEEDEMEQRQHANFVEGLFAGEHFHSLGRKGEMGWPLCVRFRKKP